MTVADTLRLLRAVAMRRQEVGEALRPAEMRKRRRPSQDNQTEGYLIVSAAASRSSTARSSMAGTARTTPTAGPGCGGGVAVGSRKVELKVGDVLIVPPGVIHGWCDIPDHVDYLSFRLSHGVMKNGRVNPTIAPE
jgi:hypothetical protein